ncbi:type VII toxin-antitoxin system HepT family RNase toxin [Colwellia echini]|uniref:DUF86 domain-containing protein n=1 Tax=Colwellia echini TaxID=1982103 RepID=A0ABY3MVV6_9GAMM|nr:DUF86 domain-containing protein [Colwellia echini]TYK65335.1 DUF86 domain-containing protein [Colwellia echini]
MVDQGLKLYLKEVRIHINEYELELKELSELNVLNSRDYRASERLLQLLTEVSIGLAKHWLKSIKKESGTSAYQTFAALENLNVICDKELTEWRKIIGLRNSLVHDYLNVDKSIIKLIIKEEKYQSILLFCHLAIKALEQ